MELRKYQQYIIDKMMWSLQLPGNDIVSAPTGSGKSVLISYFAKQLDQDVLILQPNKELLKQNMEKLLMYVDKSEVGVYSASMNEKTIGRYTFATIGSIYKKPEDFFHFRIILIDECNLTNPKNLDTMYMKFLKKIGNPKVYGFTATPFRMDVNYIRHSDRRYDIETVHTTKLINRMGKNRFWSRMLCALHVEDLINHGYLTKPTYVDMTVVEPDEIPVNKSASDYDLEKYEDMLTPHEKRIVQSLHNVIEASTATVVFCPSIQYAKRLSGLFSNSIAVSSEMGVKARNEAIEGFKSGKYKAVFNVNILSYGFDHPNIDVIVLLRPTKSLAWYMQAVGRGMRIAEDKEDCLILDFTGTVKTLGRAETLKIVKLETGWDIQTETGYWHNRELYRHKLKPRTNIRDTDDTQGYWQLY